MKGLFLIVFIVYKHYFACFHVSASLQDEIDARNRQIEQIQKQIDDYQRQIDENGQAGR